MKNVNGKKSLLTRCLLSIVIVVITSNVSFSQCGLKKSRDDFSSSVSIRSKDVTIASVFPIIGTKKPWSIKLNFLITGNLCLFELVHVSQSYSDEIKSIEFLLDDGEVIKLNEHLESSDYSSGVGNEYTISYFPISLDNLKKLTQTKLSKIRAVFLYFPDYPVVEEEVSKKNSDQIKKDANCILEEYELVADKSNDNFSDQCKYLKNEVDDFTGIRKVFTNINIIYNVKSVTKSETGMNVLGTYIGGQKGLNINRSVSFVSAAFDLPNVKSLLIFDQIDILLENSEIVSLNENKPAEFIQRGNLLTSYIIYSFMNDSIWNKIGNIPIKKLRIYKEGKELATYDIEEKYKKSFINAVNCINNLNISEPK